MEVPLDGQSRHGLFVCITYLLLPMANWVDPDQRCILCAKVYHSQHLGLLWQYDFHSKHPIKKVMFLRGLDTLERFSIIFHKGDNFCNFLFTFLHTRPLLKRGLLLKERKQILSFHSRHFLNFFLE